MRREKFKDGPSYTCWGKILGGGVRRERQKQQGKTRQRAMKEVGIVQTQQSFLRPKKNQKTSQATGQCQAKAVLYLREVLTRRLEVSWEVMEYCISVERSSTIFSN